MATMSPAPPPMTPPAPATAARWWLP